MSVCYNKLWKLLIDKNMNKSKKILNGIIVDTPRTDHSVPA